MKQTVNIDIAGAKYRMTTDADPEQLQRLAGIINDRIAELGPKALRTASPTQLLAVVALGLADDLERSEARHKTLESSTRRALEAAIARIDRRLAADDARAEEASSEEPDEAED